MPPTGSCNILACVQSYIDEILSPLVALYQDLHENPELSGQEMRTSARLERELSDLGFLTTAGVGGCGVVGVLSKGEGPVVMIRADMDALPITEETDLPYASRVRAREACGREVGVMHACGHDLHMAVLVGTAQILSQCLHCWSGTLVLVCQPSEETVSGAEKMLSDGLYARFPRPDFAMALHAGPDLAPGILGFRGGVFSAGTESLDIRVRGIGGHAAHPEHTIDPVVLASQMVLSFQTIISRELPPREFGVVTVGSIHGGAKHNAIPDEVTLQVNLRYFKEPVRDLLLSSIARIAEFTARTAGVPEDRLPVITVVNESVPPLENDPSLTDRVMSILARSLGPDRVVTIEPLSGSEDFGLFGKVEPRVPLCYFRLGTGGEVYLHNSRFTIPPEESIRNGVIAMSLAAAGLLALPDREERPDQPVPE